jgi:nucleoid-associated protein YgaU
VTQPEPSENLYTVRNGDTLWSIAADPRIYNNPYRWPQLFITNRERLVDPNNPDLIEPGQILLIPPPGNSRYYSVQEGDSYTSIATDIYNNPLLWSLLYQTNRSRMPNPDNPHLIFPGMIVEAPPAP